MSSTLIENVRIIDPESALDVIGDICINGEHIAAVNERPASFSADTVMDGTGLVAIPGLVDLYARLREPGFEKKATIKSETRAALYGGVTTLVCSPDTDPAIDEITTVELVRRQAADSAHARVLPLAALTRNLDGQHLSELATLTQAGCVGASNGDVPMRDTQVLRRAMEYAKTFDIVLVSAPIDHYLLADGCAHEGKASTRLGLPGIPVAAETVALSVLIELCCETGARVHFSRITSARGVQLVAEAKAQGLPVTADTSINHLFFDETIVNDFDGLYRNLSPFRSSDDRAALRQALMNGTLDAVCSDHAPHERDAKLAPFPSAAPGLSTIDTFLSLLLKYGRESNLSLTETLAPATCGAARVLGLTAGRIAAGKPADIVLLNAEEEQTLTESMLFSQGHNSAWLGHTLPGRVQQVSVAGQWHTPAVQQP